MSCHRTSYGRIKVIEIENDFLILDFTRANIGDEHLRFESMISRR